MPVISADLLRIGEVSARVDLPVKTIRYYEDRGLIQASRRSSGGFRLFDDTVLTRLRFIRRAQALGLSLQDIQEILAIADHGDRPCQDVRHKFQAKVSAIDERIIQLQQLRGQIVDLMAAADQTETLEAEICPIIEHAATAPNGMA
ncbi:heavy metal-responsive transcriptional regulator [Leptolyngbya sp. PCC 6406]|uniref:heavy metal-responsive transcriptional regulator n=1 Tax=Leptolyngbya sp. PCC 6406 TaxID=1173264 RepID=UPI0002ACE2EF|nr:heavy metal-responsive transcriptional regulator [Leptolyngbya sp. PCC 6406]